MKLLVTGPLGHIGSRFIHALKPGELEQVILLDNLATQRYCSLFNLPKGVPFRFIEGDIAKVDFHGLLAGVDAVIHLAAITDAANSFGNPEQVEAVNYAGTCRVAEACAARGARMVFLSTTSVYGTQEAMVDEACTEAELKPQSPYAASKLKAERFLEQLGASAGLRYVVCRFGTIYGTSIGMRFHTAINKFCWQACMGQPITVWRTALDQKRPYLDLGDAIQALRFILQKDVFDRQVYNVLTDNATVGQIVEAIRKHVPTLKVELVDSRIMNQLSYVVDNRKFRQRGFTGSGNLEQGIAETLGLLRQANGQ